jgi:hypothetical protein
MGLRYGEFLKLTKLTASPEVFAIWLLSHALEPHLQRRVLAKLLSEY